MMSSAAREVLVCLADDELCMGQQHAAWIGVGPFLEEDLAFISIAQDEIAHARALFRLLLLDDRAAATPSGTPDDVERAVDHLAMGRDATAFRSCAFVEDPCPAWEDAFVRHVLYDEAEALRWAALSSSDLPDVAALARRVAVEEEYHRRHAHQLFERLARGTEESRRRLTASLQRLLPLARTMFEPSAGEHDAVRDGVLARSSAELEAEWIARVAQLCDPLLDVRTVPAPRSAAGGRCGVRSVGFAALHEEMVKVWALDPQAQW